MIGSGSEMWDKSKSWSNSIKSRKNLTQSQATGFIYVYVAQKDMYIYIYTNSIALVVQKISLLNKKEMVHLTASAINHKLYACTT